MEKNIGKVIQIIGPVLDIRFENGHLPNLLNAIEIEFDGKKLVCEVASQIGDDVVRCIAMSSTDGMPRGIDAVDTGSGITVPVGKETLGRIFNILGDAVDDQPAPENTERWCIHRDPPPYSEQEGTTEILETGIKVIDLICPYSKGGKIGLFGGAGVGKTVYFFKTFLKDKLLKCSSTADKSVVDHAHLCTGGKALEVGAVCKCIDADLGNGIGNYEALDGRVSKSVIGNVIKLTGDSMVSTTSTLVVFE